MSLEHASQLAQSQDATWNEHNNDRFRGRSIGRGGMNGGINGGKNSNRRYHYGNNDNNSWDS